MMAFVRSLRESSLGSRLFSDHSLTQKAYLNAIASALDYGAQLAVAFIVTPLMVAALGDYYYGAWQILNRLIGYLSPATGRPTQALKWVLANRQASTDYEMKRRYVGSALLVWALFLPLLGILGGILTWFIPRILGTPTGQAWQVRATAALLFLDLAVGGALDVPRSVLQGENLGYKRMGLTTLLIFVSGAFTWFALLLGMGIVGVAAAGLAATILTGSIFIAVARNNAPWFGVARPAPGMTRQFLGLSGWFLSWNLIMKLMIASDVIVLGFGYSVASVTSYTLTKYAPETIVSIIAIAAFGVIPGLGRSIGSGDHKRATQLRGEIAAVSWLAVCGLGTAILVWNRTFLNLWVGPGHYAGALPGLLIVIVASQFVLIRNDAAIIDLTLDLRRKVIMGGVSVGLVLILSIVLVAYFNLGIVGICLGTIAGRLVLSVGYPFLVGRFLGSPLLFQLKRTVRPGIVTALLFAGALGAERFTLALQLSGIRGWLAFAIGAGLTALLALLIAYVLGLSGNQRLVVVRRLRGAIAKPSG